MVFTLLAAAEIRATLVKRDAAYGSIIESSSFLTPQVISTITLRSG
jgi:hypothetical protein